MYPLYRPELWIGYLIPRGIKWKICGAVVPCLDVRYYRTRSPVIPDESTVRSTSEAQTDKSSLTVITVENNSQ